MSLMAASHYPKISVVTPSFNQAAYLEKTIRSVLDQGYPNLEYIIIDGGSVDGSVEIIKKYEPLLTYWVSERDNGQVDAINKGLRRATGEWVAWQNSDDIYYPGAFGELAESIRKHPEASLITGDLMLIDQNDKIIRDVRYIKPDYKALLAEGMLIANQSSFWRRDLHEKIGYLDENYHCSFDYEWFLRVAEHAEGVHMRSIWGALRYHEETKTSTMTERFLSEQKQILDGRSMPEWSRAMYRLRRMCMMLGEGQFDYVFRGLRKFVTGKKGGQV
jgi:glycosyltransferase involved in cell wall biosynthesis